MSQASNSFILSVLCIYTLNVWTTLQFILWVWLCGLVLKLEMQCVYTTQQCWWVAGLSRYRLIPCIIMEVKYWSYLLNKSQNSESLQPSSVILSSPLIVLVILSMRSGRLVGWLLEEGIVFGSGTRYNQWQSQRPGTGPISLRCLLHHAT